MLLTVAASDGRIYTAEWRSLTQLDREGDTTRALKAGDRVIITASPARNPEIGRLALIREIRRPADGWRWTRGVEFKL